MVKRMADKEKLSALMDGEALDDEQLLAYAESDQDAIESWKHYHLIGDVMRGEAPEQPNWDISASVAAALEDEPVHSGADVPQIMESQPTPQVAKRQLPAWITQFGQVAVAACVSFAVILGVQQYSGQDGQVSPEADQLPVLQTIPFAGTAEPVSLTRESVQKQANEVNVQEQHRRINAVLQDYELQLRLNGGQDAASDLNDEPVVE
ncbi:sigma-E factor negative regulatory protein [Vibrio astriarenae]|nr:sigma-E factor negative regulatory protein [Vibrio astriarenae]